MSVCDPQIYITKSFPYVILTSSQLFCCFRGFVFPTIITTFIPHFISLIFFLHLLSFDIFSFVSRFFHNYFPLVSVLQNTGHPCLIPNPRGHVSLHLLFVIIQRCLVPIDPAFIIFAWCSFPLNSARIDIALSKKTPRESVMAPGISTFNAIVKQPFTGLATQVSYSYKKKVKKKKSESGW